MTNKEYLVTLSDKEAAEKIQWLVYIYSLGFTDSKLAIEDWLGKEYNENKQYDADWKYIN